MKLGIRENEVTMKKMFKQFDTNNDGELSKEEIKKGLKNCLQADESQMIMHEDDLTVLMERMDKDGNGTISY
jgi:Ca2+-binding EF-hand superfamily protein